jgi:hypothetical protein
MLLAWLAWRTGQGPSQLGADAAVVRCVVRERELEVRPLDDDVVAGERVTAVVGKKHPHLKLANDPDGVEWLRSTYGVSESGLQLLGRPDVGDVEVVCGGSWRLRRKDGRCAILRTVRVKVDEAQVSVDLARPVLERAQPGRPLRRVQLRAVGGQQVGTRHGLGGSGASGERRAGGPVWRWGA